MRVPSTVKCSADISPAKLRARSVNATGAVLDSLLKHGVDEASDVVQRLRGQRPLLAAAQRGPEILLSHVARSVRAQFHPEIFPVPVEQLTEGEVPG